MKRLIFALLALLGFGAVSCEELEGGANLDAYGVPYSEYRDSERVVNDANVAGEDGTADVNI